MALLQISEPGAAPDPHQRRIAVGIDLGTTHSLVAAVRHGVAECLPDAQGRVILPSAVRYLPRAAAPPDRRRGAGRRGRRPAQHHRLGQALHGPRPGRHRPVASKLPYDFVDAPGMLQLRTRGGRQVAGRGLGRDPGHAAPARRGQLRRRALRRRDHRAGLLRRRPAPGDQGRRAAGRPERAAPDQRADRGGRGLRPGATAARACTRSTTSAAAPSTSRCCA